MTRRPPSRAIRAAAAALVAAALCAPAVRAAPPLVDRDVTVPVTTVGRDVIDQISDARADPGRIADLLAKLPSAYTEGAVPYLRMQPPQPRFIFDPRLADAAAHQVAEQGPIGGVSHTGLDGSRPRDRIERAGIHAGAYAELISTGQRRPQDVVNQLIIDPPGPNHPHRIDLFDPLLTYAGAACGPHKTYGWFCVVDLSSTPMGAGEPPPSQLHPELNKPLSSYSPYDVLIEVKPSFSSDDLKRLTTKLRLKVADSFDSQLTGDRVIEAQIPEGRTPPDLVKDLQSDPAVLFAQPNFVFDLQAGAGGAQYAAGKLRLTEAHKLARGDHVLVAVIDSGVDAAHPELQGAIAGSFDAVGGPMLVDPHGTGVAALIAGRGRLEGAAPAAQLLTVRAFRQGGAGQGTTFSILKALDWSAAHGARVINMSFAGPEDPALHRFLAAAAARGIILVAAAGNAGPGSPPLYPAADPAVIAVAATDASDHLFSGSNRGPYVALAAPGVDLLTASVQGTYQMGTGTSFSAAEVSGVAALMLERRPDLSPADLRRALGQTARPLVGAPALVDAYRATAAAAPH